ncbi:TPA: hypothetical protein ACIBL0_004504, partial [Salmonella enterica subsp. enterica serovar Java]
KFIFMKNIRNFSIIAQINALDLGYVGEAVKHFNPEFVRGCLGVKIYD